MATEFNIPKGAGYPDLATVLTNAENVPIVLSGTVECHYRKRYGTKIIKSATYADQSVDANKGRIIVQGVAFGDESEELPEGNYKTQFWVTFSNGKLGIFPVHDAPYDNPTVNKIVIQQAI